MKAKDVLQNIKLIYKSDNYRDDLEIEYLTDDTNDFQEKSCFVCLKGNKFDSHELLPSLTIKPNLIIAERQIETDIPYVIVENAYKIMPILAFNFYHDPSSKLNLIGVTGTDGKTTTSLILKQLIDYFKDCAYVGTNGFHFKEHILKSKLTTPKPFVLNRFLNDLINQNIHYASLEVSSQGLSYHRLDLLRFKVAIFTNLSHEHLDYHKTIENYFQSKLKLFKMLTKDSYAIINIDEQPYANQIINQTQAKVFTYGKNMEADFRISNITTTFSETTFDLITKDNVFRNIKLNLFGDYNVYNTTAALASLHAMGFPIEKVLPQLNRLQSIEGRMQIIDCGQPFSVIVDFAHTPNALNALLRNLSTLNNGQLTVIFGSAGERDVSKRPLMGETVNTYASNIILTNEDPKSEDSLDIIQDILKGIDNPFKVNIIPNRKQAIIKALNEANKNDMVVITGKGNEQYQMYNGYLIEHNDIEIAKQFLFEKYQSQPIYSIANM